MASASKTDDRTGATEEDPSLDLRRSRNESIRATQIDEHMDKATAVEASRSTAKQLDIDEETARAIRLDQEEIHGPTARDEPAQHAQNMSPDPVLTEDDEKFLERATSEIEFTSSSRRTTLIADNGDVVEEVGEDDLPDAGVEAQEENGNLAKGVPLPDATPQEKQQLQAKSSGTRSGKEPQTWKDRWNQWSFIPSSAPSLAFNAPALWGISASKKQDKTKQKSSPTEPSTDPSNQSEAAPNGKGENKDEEQTKRDLSSLLHSLDLSSINNRVVGISNDTQELLENFNVVLKDLINGAPTAYHDLETLLRTKETQLDKLFTNLPPFLQTLVKSIPVRMYAALAPQLAAAVATDKRSGSPNVNVSGVTSDPDEANGQDQKGSKKDTKKKKKTSILPNLKSLPSLKDLPTLKNLIGQKGTVAAMLRSILKFLEMRFPAFLTGTNVLMSLAVFILLFVFWYCHKRGKETRLEAEEDSGVPIDPSLDDLERITTFKQSADGLRLIRTNMDREKAVDVPLDGGVGGGGGGGGSADDKDLEG